MANYTSTQSGNWSSAATWGGAGVPGAGDSVTVSGGFTVVYDAIITGAGLAALTIGSGSDASILQFSTIVSTILTMANADLFIKARASLNVGTSGAVIPKGISAQLLWNTAGNNALGINIANGGMLNIYGDPSYYGGQGNDRQVLNASWTSGQTFTVTGSGAQSWNVGDVVTVHKNAMYSSWQTDVQQFTIASIAANGSNTNITIVQAAPGLTFNAGAQVGNVTRNVWLTKPGYSPGTGANGSQTLIALGSYMANEPRVIDANGAGSSNINVCDSNWIGFQCTFAYNAQLIRSIFCHSNGYGIYQGTGHTISYCSVYSNNNGISYSYRHSISFCSVHSNFYGFSVGTGHTLSSCLIYSNYCGYNGGAGNTLSSCLVYLNYIGFSNGTGHTISSCLIYLNTFGINGGIGFTLSSCFIYSNSFGLWGVIGLRMVGGACGYDNMGTSYPNGNDVNITSFLVLSGVLTSVPMNISGRNNSAYSPQRIGIEFYGSQSAPTSNNWIVDAYGDIYEVPADGSGSEARPMQRSGGSANIIEILPQSNCSSSCPLYIFPPPNFYFNRLRIWHTGDGLSHTYTFYLQATFAAQLNLAARYLTASIGGASAQVTTLETISVRSSNTDWSQAITVTIPATTQDGWVEFDLSLTNYVASSYLWLDPQWVKV